MCTDRWQEGLDRRAEEKQPAHQTHQPVPGRQHVRRHQRQVRQQLQVSQHKHCVELNIFTFKLFDDLTVNFMKMWRLFFDYFLIHFLNTMIIQTYHFSGA